MKRSRKDMTLLIMVFLLIAGVVVLSGCRKKTESTAGAAEIVQKTCPVMGSPIDKNLYTEYEGKKVYFCCASCKEAFEKEPEKYLSKLPQFSESEQTQK